MLALDFEPGVIFQRIIGNINGVLARKEMCACVFLNDVKTQMPLPLPAAAAAWEKDAG